MFNTQKPAFGSTNTLAQSNTLQNIAGQAGQQQGGHAQGVPPNGSATAMYDPAKETEGNAQNQVKCVYHSITVMKPFQGANFEVSCTLPFRGAQQDALRKTNEHILTSSSASLDVGTSPERLRNGKETATGTGRSTSQSRIRRNQHLRRFRHSSSTTSAKQRFWTTCSCSSSNLRRLRGPCCEHGWIVRSTTCCCERFRPNEPAGSFTVRSTGSAATTSRRSLRNSAATTTTAGLFGTPAAPAGGNMFAGGSQNQNAAAPAFGGGLFGAAKPAAAAPSTFNFGTQAAAPAAQNANPFGAQQNAQAAPAAQTGFGGFGQQPAAPPAPAFGFGQRKSRATDSMSPACR